MTHLLIDEPFTSHSGLHLPFKIDCDVLTDADLATVANIVTNSLAFGYVHFVPRGGVRFAQALLPYAVPGGMTTLIVDDVLTTGHSMEELRHILLKANPEARIVGIVLFARGPCPSWITPFFTLHEAWQ